MSFVKGVMLAEHCDEQITSDRVRFGQRDIHEYALVENRKMLRCGNMGREGFTELRLP